MTTSVLDIFTIGIGPSSSHTVGPMRAAKRFVDGLERDGHLPAVHRVCADLFGSLALTGKGHGSDKAILMGLEGETPETIDPPSVTARVHTISNDGQLRLAGGPMMAIDTKKDLVFRGRETLPAHPNGMRFTAFDTEGGVLAERTYYSVGGGFVLDETAAEVGKIVADKTPVPLPFLTGAELLEVCAREDLAIWEVMMRNESVWRGEAETREKLLGIAVSMQRCIETGCGTEGVLPGGLKVRRRAPLIYHEMKERPGIHAEDPLVILDWVSLFAMAVNEENAAGGRVVTAPTNGAAGIMPAVLEYYRRFVPSANDDGIVIFLLTAAAIAILFKENASISGAEVGCQGEVGVACSMAAAALVAVLGGSVVQVENAAEIGMEHNLGLTCDPVGGLVQVPCIERNAMGATKAINAARLALRGDGRHLVSLDKVIKTMRETGADMKLKYKETSRGGLAVNVIEC